MSRAVGDRQAAIEARLLTDNDTQGKPAHISGESFMRMF
jgi:hypothetical protein